MLHSVPDWVVLKGMLVELFSTQLHRLMDNFLQFHGGVLQIATRRVMAYLPNHCGSGLKCSAVVVYYC